MGFFSWVTSDTARSISNTYSSEGAFDVYMILPNLTEEGAARAAGYGYEGDPITRVRHTPALIGKDPGGIGESGCLGTLEKAYDGYGIFGGVCFYAALFELNRSKYSKSDLEKIKTYDDRRNEGIKIETRAIQQTGFEAMKSEGWVFPILIENKSTIKDLGIGQIKWQDLDFCHHCPHQGYFY
tara:strand:- start:453 stop:1001 length:549 start_codon:yes stop_codon:yes gene_type:complete